MMNQEALLDLKNKLHQWALALGFADCTVARVDALDAAWEATEAAFNQRAAAGFYGEMDYMVRHGSKRTRPAELQPGTVSVLSLRMNYWSEDDRARAEALLGQRDQAYVSRYALGRDYHKVLRNRLQKLAEQMAAEIGPFGHRVFVDSAPVLEVALAAKSGLGWRGKHTLLLSREAGSLFFLGELYTDLPLPADEPVTEHCGECTRCIDICPTQAIVAPYEVDARRCISYLTIELKGSIPTEFRPLLGNRIYGCDDCQLVCPWNRFAQQTPENDFAVRNGLDAASLLSLFAWTEAEFTARMAGSAILRIGFERWSRNIAVALGNAPRHADVVAALQARYAEASPLLQEHIAWALAQHECPVM